MKSARVKRGGEQTALVLPDIATCADCLREVFDPADRRHLYPFTNCTNCGPRFSIIEGLPYDRAATTMRHFEMCPECRAEYEDPLNRRFHAQPNACPVCGPRVELWRIADCGLRIADFGGVWGALDGAYNPDTPTTVVANPECAHSSNQFETEIPESGGERESAIRNPQSAILAGRLVVAHGNDAIVGAAEALRRGEIVAVKGLGGFHLMVDARNEAAVGELRRRKRREEKPFALMVASVEAAREYCEVSPLEERLLESPECPIVILRRLAGAESDAHFGENPTHAELPQGVAAAETSAATAASGQDGGNAGEAARAPSGGSDSESGTAAVFPRHSPHSSVAPGNPTLGVMLPCTPLHHILMRELGFPLVATSGNLSDEPICTGEEEAWERLAGIADCFLVHDRPITRHVDDSIARIVAGREMVLRRARGYAPYPVPAPRSPLPVLAVGAHLKNTVAITAGAGIVVSQHIGDLDTPQAHEAFRRVAGDLARLHGVDSAVVACDMHPDYLSTQFARATGLPVIAVQHHHAHIAACMAENEVGGPALGVSWDGTGWGEDGTVWGGEFLEIADFGLRISDCKSDSVPGVFPIGRPTGRSGF